MDTDVSLIERVVEALQACAVAIHTCLPEHPGPGRSWYVWVRDFLPLAAALVGFLSVWLTIRAGFRNVRFQTAENARLALDRDYALQSADARALAAALAAETAHLGGACSGFVDRFHPRPGEKLPRSHAENTTVPEALVYKAGLTKLGLLGTTLVPDASRRGTLIGRIVAAYGQLAIAEENLAHHTAVHRAKGEDIGPDDARHIAIGFDYAGQYLRAVYFQLHAFAAGQELPEWHDPVARPEWRNPVSAVAET